MNYLRTERSHPSLIQIETLLKYLEENPLLVKGCLRNSSAKAQAQREWEQLTTKLNCIRGGTVKSAQKWIRYWIDKKSSVKRKAFARDAAKRIGGIEVPELNEIEERVVTLIKSNGSPLKNGTQLQAFDKALKLEQSEIQNSDTCDPLQDLNKPTRLQSPLSREVSPIDNSSSANVSSTQTQSSTSSPESSPSPVSTPPTRRARMRRSSSKRQGSQFNNIAEKLIRIEKSRLSFEHRVVRVLERHVETERLMAKANIALGEGLKALAEAIKNK